MVSFISTDNTNNINTYGIIWVGPWILCTPCWTAKEEKEIQLDTFRACFETTILYFQVCDGALLSATNKHK